MNEADRHAFDRAGARVATTAHARRALSLQPRIDYLATEHGRSRIERAMATKVAELVAGHGAATSEALRCLFSCRELQACFAGAVRRLPPAIREIAFT